MPTNKPLHPLVTTPWPPGSRRVYYVGVLFWVLVFQGLAILLDLFYLRAWWIWHTLSLVSSLVIGHITTMRILAIAIQEWKNRV